MNKKERAMKKLYFVSDPEGDGMVFFGTIEDRDEYAATCISHYLEVDGWADAVEFIISGVITHRSTRVDLQKRPDDLDEDGIDGEGVFWDSDIDYRCNYRMMPIEGVL